MNKNIIKKLLVNSGLWFIKGEIKYHKYHKHNRKLENEIRNKKTKTIVFFACNLPMWHYNDLYKALLSFKEVSAYIVLSPINSYTSEQKTEDLKLLREYFDAQGLSYIDFDLNNSGQHKLPAGIIPDVCFYPQPYDNLLIKGHNFTDFPNSLLAHYPYGFWMEDRVYAYNQPFHNIAWRLYYETKYHAESARNNCYYGDRNVVVTGYPNADIFTQGNFKDPWRQQSNLKKRVIWAPHYSILPGVENVSNFLWMANLMLEIANKYKDRIQFAFKPHPRLKTELYKHPEWGKEKTDWYYDQWLTRENLQLETGAFIDLFMTSDAMVHDSGSFCVEYLYTHKPVMYVYKKDSGFYNSLSKFGKKVLDLHYPGYTKTDIEIFIEETVVGLNDPMKNGREEFLNNTLLPPNGKTVLQNTLDDLLTSLNIRN